MGWIVVSCADDLKEELYEKNDTRSVRGAGSCYGGILLHAGVGQRASLYGCAR